MYKLVIIIILASLLIAGYIGAESLPSPSSNDTKASKANQQSNGKQDDNSQPSLSAVPSGPTKLNASPYDPSQPATSSGDDKTKNNDSDYFGGWPPTSGWSVAYITFAYAVIALFQLLAIFYQARITRQALTTSERAWIKIGFDRSYILGDGFIDLEIYNSGKSVGHIKDIQLFGFELVDKGKTTTDNPKSVHPPGMGIFTIFPGESIFQRWDVQIDKKEIVEVTAKTKLLRIYGFVRYADIFKTEHITKFYRVWMDDDGPSAGKFMIPPDAAPGQNEAT